MSIDTKHALDGFEPLELSKRGRSSDDIAIRWTGNIVYLSVAAASVIAQSGGRYDLRVNREKRQIAVLPNAEGLWEVTVSKRNHLLKGGIGAFHAVGLDRCRLEGVNHDGILIFGASQ